MLKIIGHIRPQSRPFQRPARVAVQSAIGANMEDMFGMIRLLLIALGIGAVFFWVYRPMR